MKETFRVPVHILIGQHAITATMDVDIDIAAELLDSQAIIKHGVLAVQNDLLEAIEAKDTARLLRLIADKLDTARAEK